jgi:NAD(P)-dependent dehydrogenase (short-subunit alcohol dehydrogenase family)
MKTVLITGAGTGFGHEVAMRMAKKGFNVIAGVEIYAQVQTLKRQAAARGVSLQVEKLDVTDDGDRRKALAWNVEIFVNNAGVLEGGSVVDIPALNIHVELLGVQQSALLCWGRMERLLRASEANAQPTVRWRRGTRNEGDRQTSTTAGNPAFATGGPGASRP